MVFKFKDVVNHKINSANQQHSFDLRKRRLKQENISIDELLEINITKKMLKQIE